MKTVLSLVLILTISLAFAGNIKDKEQKPKSQSSVSISGKIVDSISKEALTGVKIYVEELNQVVYTDFDGNFYIPVSTDTEISKLKISYISYEEKSVEINAGSSLNIEINKVF